MYPLTAYAPKQPPPCRSRAISPETAESVKSVTPEPIDIESRRVVNMMCSVKPREYGCDLLVSHINHRTASPDSPKCIGLNHIFNGQMTILLRMDDKMNRQLTCQVSQDDTAMSLSHELVHLGFIHEVSYRIDSL